MTDRGFQDLIYAQFARFAQAFASEKRLELVDLLAQAPDEAVVRLRSEGFKAVRLDGGWPEWVAEDRPTESRVEGPR